MNKIISDSGMSIRLGNKAIITDPCYGVNKDNQRVIDSMLPGVYDCSYEVEDDVVTAILIKHTSIKDTPIIFDIARYDIPINNTLCGIFDYTYYVAHYNNLSKRNVSDKLPKTADNKAYFVNTNHTPAYDCYAHINDDGIVDAIMLRF